MDFRVPNLGEGIESATVIRVLVSPGTAVSEGQDLVEVETEKANITIPAPAAGTVENIQVKPGDKIKIGTVLMTTGEALAKSASAPAQAPKAEKPTIPTATNAALTRNEAPKSAGAQRTEFRIPDLGEGIASGTVVNVLVKPGDAITADQPIIELETEKATIPIPTSLAGQIEEVRTQVGQVVKVGQVVAVIASEAATPAKALARVAGAAGPTQAAEPSPPRSKAPSPRPHEPTSNGNGRLVPASPATRRLARELGVDLHHVTGSAAGGRVTQDDIKAFVRGLSKGPTAAPSSAGIAVPPLPDFSKYGPVEKKPFSALRKAIARNLTVSWNVCPQVTQHDLADITELEAGRKRFVESAPHGSPKVTMTVLAVKACVAALKAFPNFNASYDAGAGENGELILKRYYHICIAVDTERGLLVPVIRDADKKSVSELAKDVADLAEKARAGKLTPDEMRGGTFTITNLGGIGGTAFSPIINYPEVAILGLSRSMLQPVVRGDKVEPRLMLPLSLTYDHRVIDGADGARFCARLAAAFSDPLRLLFES
ncbi:MAG: 2-oxo acid dehydrogenase subunit E2 [Gemmataceae bacterium]